MHRYGFHQFLPFLLCTAGHKALPFGVIPVEIIENISLHKSPHYEKQHRLVDYWHDFQNFIDISLCVPLEARLKASHADKFALGVPETRKSISSNPEQVRTNPERPRRLGAGYLKHTLNVARERIRHAFRNII